MSSVLRSLEIVSEDMLKQIMRNLLISSPIISKIQRIQILFFETELIIQMKAITIFLTALLVLAQLGCSLRLQHFASITSAIPIDDLLKYMNYARTNPNAFAKYVSDEIARFTDSNTLPLYPGMNYRTNQGIGAWKEAQSFLLNQEPLQPMQLNEGLSLAAEDHAIDMSVKGFMGHDSSDGRSVSDRIVKRCGQTYGSWGENIGSQFKVSGRDHALQTIMSLIIDDGVANRGHRKNIFSTSFKYVGIASRVQNDKILTVFNYHSENVPTIDSTANTNNAGTVVNDSRNNSQPSNQSGGYGSTPQDESGAKRVIRTQVQTRRNRRTGVTTKITTTYFSDGSVETRKSTE